MVQAQQGGLGGAGAGVVLSGGSSHTGGVSVGAGVAMRDQQVLSAIVAFQLAVSSYVSVARQLLAAYGGYECKVGGHH